VKVAIILGSESDREFAQSGLDVLKASGIDYEVVVHSAHRDLDGLLKYIHSAKDVNIIIAVAGMAAVLPGIVASNVEVPVIGVPREVGPFKGIDALLSMLQVPKGVPLATMGIGESGMINASQFAIRILKMTKNAN
jgi:phosphoribosylaminoimidazole carboxylase PurE protein